MKRLLGVFLRRVRTKAEIRRSRTRQRVAANRDFDETHGGSIWRSGKGGSHIG